MEFPFQISHQSFLEQIYRYHGKGPCDAIGGTIKRMARTASLQRALTDQIRSAKELFEWIKTKENIKIDFDFCSERDHRNIKIETRSKYNKVKTIPGTRKYHAFIPISESKVSYKRYSLSASTFQFSLI
jgi:hypothetical protein